MTIPEPGITTIAKVVKVVDVDTIAFEIKRTFHIRIKDLLGAEKNTEKGKLEKAFLENLLKDNQELIVFIPTNDPHKLMDINSFNRLLGDVWLKDGRNLLDVLVENGMGRRLRKGEKPHAGE